MMGAVALQSTPIRPLRMVKFWMVPLSAPMTTASEVRPPSMTKTLAALIIFIFLVPYSASVYTGLAYLFETVFKINFTTALWSMATLTAVYLVLGGYLAVARNDAIQGVVMIVGVIVMIYFVIKSPEVGGLSHGLSHLKAIDPSLTAAWPFLCASSVAAISKDKPMARVLVLLPARDFDPSDYMEAKQARRMERFSQFSVAAARMAQRIESPIRVFGMT